MSAAKRQKQSNVIKAPVRPKRFFHNPNEDPSSGLWVDHELLGKHMSSRPKFLIPADSAMVAYNHYLELADLALNKIETTPRRSIARERETKKEGVPINPK